ncbi:MAG: RNHCP domain-containing protein [bacterium]|nr:RNHCP domain-containing protein [bacterium]
MKRFTRKIEDFVCDQCTARVTGTGYTNHCPKCLWSKHVDVSPGDRSSLCGGAMEPTGVSVLSGTYRILHTCARCGFIRAQDAATEDDMEKLILLSTRPHTDWV